MAEIFFSCVDGAGGVNYDTKIMVKRPSLCMDECFVRRRRDSGDNN